MPTPPLFQTHYGFVLRQQSHIFKSWTQVTELINEKTIGNIATITPNLDRGIRRFRRKVTLPIEGIVASLKPRLHKSNSKSNKIKRRSNKIKLGSNKTKINRSSVDSTTLCLKKLSLSYTSRSSIVATDLASLHSKNPSMQPVLINPNDMTFFRATTNSDRGRRGKNGNNQELMMVNGDVVRYQRRKWRGWVFEGEER